MSTVVNPPQVSGGTPGPFQAGTLDTGNTSAPPAVFGVPLSNPFPTKEVHKIGGRQIEFLPGPIIGGAVGGPVGIAIGAGISVIGGILSGIFSGPSTPTPADQFASFVQSIFPHDDQLICGTPIDLSMWNSGQPAVLNIDCGDPNVGSMTVKYFIHLIHDFGMGFILKNLATYIAVGTPAGGQSTSESAGGEGPINVTVNDISNVSDTVLRSVADAVNSGITQSASNVSDVVKGAFGSIGDALKNIADSIWNGVKDAVSSIASHIGDIVGGIYSHLSDIFKVIVDNVGTILSKIKDTLVEVIGKVAPVLDSITQQIQKINDTLIQPIATFINTTVKTVADLTVAIEKDLHDGLSGILKIPSDISTGLSSLDATMQRTVEQLGTVNKATVDSTFKTSDGINVAQHLKEIGDNLTKSSGFTAVHEAFPDRVKLSEPSAVTIEKEVVSALKTLMSDMFSVLVDVISDPMKAATAGIVGTGLAASGLLEVGTVVATLVELLLSVGRVVDRFVEEEINKKAPLAKLDPQTTAQAMLRRFISAETFQEELLVQGYDSTRAKVLQDLTAYYVPADAALEWWYRGIINEVDLNTYLQYQGYDPKQIIAAKEASVKPIAVDAALTAWRRGVIDDAQLESVFQENRFSEAEREMARLLTLRPRQTDEAISDATHQFAAGEADIFATINQQAPETIAEIARINGQDSSVANVYWRTHWQVPALITWVNLYFRGVRTKTELTAAMDYFAVPREMQDDVIEAMRPLIPYRSLPSYVKAGIMSDADARAELSAHGFSLRRVNQIMEFATKATSAKASTATNQIAAISESTAHTLFIDGAITKEQYVGILEQHGLPPTVAQAQADAVELQEHAKQRKLMVSDAIAQVENGSMTLDDAVQALTLAGLTATEIARFQNTVVKQIRATAKLPSIAELDKFLKAQLIDIDQYKNGLISLGWQDPWLTAFMGLVSPTPEQQSTVPPGIP